jgi:hypothetical protein
MDLAIRNLPPHAYEAKGLLNGFFDEIGKFADAEFGRIAPWTRGVKQGGLGLGCCHNAQHTQLAPRAKAGIQIGFWRSFYEARLRKILFLLRI